MVRRVSRKWSKYNQPVLAGKNLQKRKKRDLFTQLVAVTNRNWEASPTTINERLVRSRNRKTMIALTFVEEEKGKSSDVQTNESFSRPSSILMLKFVLDVVD